jgi:DNA-binding NtrC family response regulator
MLTAPQLESRIEPLVRPHTVIVLDDDRATLAALKRTLRGEPYDLLTADDPDQVLRWIESREVSLVVSDLRMPEMEGTELLEEVRRRSPLTMGVLITAYPESLQMDPDLRRWVRWVILKPWEDGWLRGTLRHLLEKREETFQDPPEPLGA